MASLPAAPPASRRWPGLGLVVLLCLSLGKRERPEGERGPGGPCWAPSGGARRAVCGDWRPAGHSSWRPLPGLRLATGLGGGWLADHGGER